MAVKHKRKGPVGKRVKEKKEEKVVKKEDKEDKEAEDLAKAFAALEEGIKINPLRVLGEMNTYMHRDKWKLSLDEASGYSTLIPGLCDNCYIEDIFEQNANCKVAAGADYNSQRTADQKARDYTQFKLLDALATLKSELFLKKL